MPQLGAEGNERSTALGDVKRDALQYLLSELRLESTTEKLDASRAVRGQVNRPIGLVARRHDLIVASSPGRRSNARRRSEEAGNTLSL